MLNFLPAGTLLICRGKGLLAKGIRWAETMPGEKPSWANHIAGVTKGGVLIPEMGWKGVPLAEVSEALWHNENHVWWEHHQKDAGYEVKAYLPPKMTSEQQDIIVADWLSREGVRYPTWKLFGYLGERLTLGAIPFTRLFFIKRRVVCSEHMALGYQKAGIDLPEGAMSMDPDDFDDFARENWTFLGHFTVPNGE